MTMLRTCQTGGISPNYLTKFVILLAILAWMVPAAARTPDNMQPPSIMQIEWQRHLGKPYELHPANPFRVAPVPYAQQQWQRTRQVMGYLPYWQFNGVTLHTDILSVLAYFGVSCNSDGSLNNPHHWSKSNSAFQSLLQTCHENGVKVVLTVTNFKSSSITTLLSSSTYRHNLVNNLVKMVTDAGGDGVNVDFEGVSKSVKPQLVSLMKALKQAMDASIPGGANVTIATPAIDWNGAFDYDELAAATDGMFIMGYDYHWPGGEPGPVSPLTHGSIWGKYDLYWTVSDYFKYGGQQNRGKFILGLPLYAYDWACTGSAIPGHKVSGTKGTPVIWSAAQAEAQGSGGWQWDQASQTVYYTYNDQHLHQVWGDDLKTMGLKFDLVNEKDLGGFGFWALGYANDPALWEAIRKAAFEQVSGGDTDDTTPDQAEEVIQPEPEPEPEPEPVPDVAEDVQLPMQDTYQPPQDTYQPGTDTAVEDMHQNQRDIGGEIRPEPWDAYQSHDTGKDLQSTHDTYQRPLPDPGMAVDTATGSGQDGYTPDKGKPGNGCDTTPGTGGRGAWGGLLLMMMVGILMLRRFD